MKIRSKHFSQSDEKSLEIENISNIHPCCAWHSP